MNGPLLPLIICNFSILFVGMGVFPLLPVYAEKFGATPSATGVYLALTYVAITLGTLLTGWLSGKVPRKPVFVLAGLLGAPALFLLGQPSAFWQVELLTGIVWFTGGVGLALIGVFTGLYAEEGSRGRWFSFISLTTPLGAIVGGSLTGRLVEGLGYPAMFAMTAGVYAIWPLVGLLKVKDRPFEKAPSLTQKSDSRAKIDITFPLLLLAALLSAITISVSRLGLSLTMKTGGFTPSAITGANAIGGFLTIPVVLGFGSLSDRLGRKWFLALGYVLSAAGGIILIFADQLWHFWLAAASVLMSRSVTVSLASALTTDLLAPEILDRALPWLNTMTWIAGVLGFAGSGYVIEKLGAGSLFSAAAFLSLVAAGLVGLISICRRGVARGPSQAAGGSGAPIRLGYPECPAP